MLSTQCHADSFSLVVPLTGGNAAGVDCTGELGGAALRLLHAVAAQPAGAEALTRGTPPAVPTLLTTMQSGLAARVLALETLLRALDRQNRVRDALVGSAVASGIVPRLLATLNWRASQAQSLPAYQDPVRKHAAFPRVCYPRSHQGTL